MKLTNKKKAGILKALKKSDELFLQVKQSVENGCFIDKRIVHPSYHTQDGLSCDNRRREFEYQPIKFQSKQTYPQS